MGKIVDKFENGLSGLLIFLAYVLVLFVFLAIVIRYTPFTGLWTNELARLFLLWAAFTAAGRLEKVNGHFRFEMFEHSLSGKRRLFLELFNKLVVVISMGFVVWWAIVYAGSSIGQSTYLLQWPWIIRAIPLLFGSLLLFVYSLVGFIQKLQRLF